MYSGQNISVLVVCTRRARVYVTGSAVSIAVERDFEEAVRSFFLKVRDLVFPSWL